MNNTYRLSLMAKTEVAKETVEFDFQKPADFSYLAGQYGVWTIPELKPSDEKGNRRDFTISSAPFEDHLSFTTRIRDTAFKKWASKMKIGDQIEMEGPFGDLILPKNIQQPVVFLAGGIGITPFRSILTQMNHDQMQLRVYLFYSNRVPEDATYIKELTSLASDSNNLQIIPIMTQPEKSKLPWTGEIGYINNNLLKKYLEDNLNKYLYFIAGPPRMVDGMREILNSLQIAPESVLGENFGGY